LPGDIVARSLPIAIGHGITAVGLNTALRVGVFVALKLLVIVDIVVEELVGR